MNTSSMTFTHNSTGNGYICYDVKGAGSINKVSLETDIKKGDTFNIHYGNGDTNTPFRKDLATWSGVNGGEGDVTQDLIDSITSSDLYIGTMANSDAFFDKVVEKFNKCECEEPNPTKESMDLKNVVAVDLDHGDHIRHSGRWLALLTECDCCNKPLTMSQGFAFNCPAGIKHVKEDANKRTRTNIKFNSIITSINQL